VESVHDNGSRLNVVRDSFQMLCEVLKIRYHLLFGMYNHATPSYQTVAPVAAPATVGDNLGAASATN